MASGAYSAVGNDALFSDSACSTYQLLCRREPFVERATNYSAATPAAVNMSGPSSAFAEASADKPSFAASDFAFCLRSKLSQTSPQLPRVAALEYSVARVSKKLACSTPFNSGASHGRGCSSTMK